MRTRPDEQKTQTNIYFPTTEAEESDEDMGFGLFD